jgi:glucokinase
MEKLRLLADVGGSNVRFCLSSRRGDLHLVRAFSASRFADFCDALTCYFELKEVAEIKPQFIEFAVAAAGSVECGVVQLTNSAWRIDAKEISDRFGVPVHLFNDLEAAAFALPQLAGPDIVSIGGNWSILPSATRIVINIGTGFGAAAAHWNGDGKWNVAPSEAGHMSIKLSPGDAASLPTSISTIEDILSGVGLEHLYETVASGVIGGAHRKSASEILSSISTDAHSAHLSTIFTRALSDAAADLVLAHAAWGGLYLCGSVAKGWHRAADLEQFRLAFVRNGKMHGRLARVPTWLITVEQPSLLGLSFARS